MTIRPGHRVPFLLLGFLALALGVTAGLGLLGWPGFAQTVPSLLVQHGALMICGFFGTLISLERAVALGRLWVYAGPALAGAGTLLLLTDLPLAGAAGLYLGASLVLSAASWRVYQQHPALFTATLALGATCWSLGTLIWLLGGPALQIRLWWLSFLILTIAGERLELSRFLAPPPSVQRQVAALLVLLLASLAASVRWPTPGTWVFGLLLILLSLWLARYDIAKRTVRMAGLTRFIAVCLLSAYAWLALAGVLMVIGGGLHQGGFYFDAAVHAITLGFVFGMVFGHAPIILPSVLRVNLAYRPRFYLHFALLQLSLLLRVYGDLSASPDWRGWGGALNAIAIGLFLINTLTAVARGRAAPSSFRAR